MPDDEYEYDDRDPIEVLTDRLMEDPRAQQMFQKARGVLDQLGNAIDRIGVRPSPPSRRPRRPTRPRMRRPPPAPPKTDPRVIMGFPLDMQLTVKIVKKRRQELSALFHPDRGGNSETMQRINAAADDLLALL